MDFMSAVLSVRVKNEVVAELDRLAASYERPRNWIIGEAIAHYLALQGQHVAELDAAEAEIEADRFHTHEQAGQLIEERRGARRKKKRAS